MVWWLVVCWRTISGWGKEEALEGTAVRTPSYPRLANKQRYGRLPEVAYLQHSESVSWVQAYKRR